MRAKKGHSPRFSGHIWLSGFMGVGKSTVGRTLATKVGRPFIDLDDRVEQEVGRSVSQIFADHGELEFRRREGHVLLAVLDEAPSVVALGGGTVLSEPRRHQIRAVGALVTLTARCETLAGRLRSENRPQLQGYGLQGRIKALLAERARAYADSNFAVSTDGRTPSEVADAIVLALRAL